MSNPFKMKDKQPMEQSLKGQSVTRDDTDFPVEGSELSLGWVE